MPIYKPYPKYKGIYYRKKPRQFLTVNLDRDRAVYGEKLIDFGEIQLRVWNPNRSKLCAALHQNARDIFIRPQSRVLYLGASSGTTVSHVSDIVVKGIVYAVEFSPRSIRELIQNTSDRFNVVPILGDANHPYEYSKYISGEIDIIYQDVAQPNQTEILIKNADAFLKPGGNFIYCIKARSIDTFKDPNRVFKEQKEILEKNGFTITDDVDINPYQADHHIFFGTYSEK